MADRVTNYQCPACTGPLHFSGATGRLECEYCGSSYEVAEIEASLAAATAAAETAAAKDAERESREAGDVLAERSAEAGDGAGAALKTYNCPSCGAELICEENTIATSCPYCGNPSVVPGTVRGEFKPDFVIPFKYEKEAALAALKEFYKGKKFLPSGFTDGNHLEEIKGVYVPFWLYEGAADAAAEFEASRSRTYTTSSERVTTTDHYRVLRAGCMDFDYVPADASTKMPDNYMDAVEPFDYDDLKPYSHAYLPGFLASSYDVDAEECFSRVEPRISATALETLRRDVTGYQSVRTVRSKCDVSVTARKYALLPVWLLATRWNGESFLFAMNGQTGRFVGNLPVSAGKFALWFLGLGIPLGCILGALAMFL